MEEEGRLELSSFDETMEEVALTGRELGFRSILVDCAFRILSVRGVPFMLVDLRELRPFKIVSKSSFSSLSLPKLLSPPGGMFFAPPGPRLFRDMDFRSAISFSRNSARRFLSLESLTCLVVAPRDWKN